MIFWILLAISVWIMGAVVFGALDGWFEYGMTEGELFWSSVFWPIIVPLVLPFLLYEFLHAKLKEAKKKKKIRIANEEKIRIAAEKELEKIEEEIEASLQEEAKKPRRLKR